jgi:hypothetical protein
MATEAWKEKRLETTGRLIEKAKAKLAKAEADQEKAEAEVLRLEGLVEWLQSMPVENTAVQDDEPEATLEGP